jgi:hypothetical protein
MSDVSQGEGWWQASDGKWYSPEQKSADPIPTASAPASTPSSGSGLPAFAFDLKRLSKAEQITGGATLVLFISLFLPWFTYRYTVVTVSGTISVNGLWHGWMYLVLLLCLGIMAYLVAIAGFGELPFKLPMAREQLLLVATAVNFVLSVLAFLLKPGGYGFGGIGWGFGAFLGLIASVVAALPLGLPAIQARRK